MSAQLLRHVDEYLAVGQEAGPSDIHLGLNASPDRSGAENRRRWPHWWSRSISSDANTSLPWKIRLNTCSKRKVVTLPNAKYTPTLAPSAWHCAERSARIPM